MTGAAKKAATPLPPNVVPDASGQQPEAPPAAPQTQKPKPKPKAKSNSVKKRNGTLEPVSFDKVLQRLRKLAAQPTQLDVNPDDLAATVITQIVDGVETQKLDELAAQLCSSRIADHPHWNTLAARILINNHTKNTNQSFSETVEQLHAHVDVHGKPSPLVSDQLLAVTTKNKRKINDHIKYARDYDLDYFGAQTLLNGSYLMRINGKVVERPAHMFMRVALGIHGEDVKAALETYDLMSTKKMIHASPTLFSAGTPTPQMSSCFVAGTSVYTLNAGAKAIEDVAVGDVVVTHLGQAKPVVQTHANPLNGRALYDFKVFKGPTITATEDHPFMSLTAEQEGWGVPPQWNALGALRVGDFVEIPRFEPSALVPPTFDVAALYSACKDGREPNVKRVWRLADLPFCQLLGEWAGHGHFPDFVGTGIALAVGGDVEKRAFLEAAGKAFGDVETSIVVNAYTADDVGYDVLFFESALVSNVLVAAFGKRGAMRLPPQAHTWHTKMVKAFLMGFGPVMNARTGEYPDDERALRRDVFNLARSRGLVHHDKWSTAVMKTVGGRTFLRIEAKVPSARADVETVYTLGVEDDHSYAVDGVIARNCFLVASKADSIDGIFSTIKEMALISKYAGGIGVHVSNIRAKGTAIRGTNGIADGLVPMLRLVNDTALYVNQGGGKRPGAIAVYLEPWHADVMAFISLRKTTGDMKQRCLDLFTALWCPDLLVRRVKAGADWSLMCPDECPGLADVWGAEFDALYLRYEAEGRARSKMPAVDLWKAICLAQVETGTPYLLYKDHFNAKSNQKNLGTIKSSNLCCEIGEVSSPEETAVCLSGDTKVVTERRGEVRLADVRAGDRVLALFEADDRFDVRPRFCDAALIDNGERDVVEVSLDDGTAIKATPDHRFLVHTFEGGYAWKAAAELRAGDDLVAPRALPLPGYDDVTAADVTAALGSSSELQGEAEEVRQACMLGSRMARPGAEGHMAAATNQARAGKPIVAAAYLRGLFTAGAEVNPEAGGAAVTLAVPAAGSSPPNPREASLWGTTSGTSLRGIAELLRRFGIDSESADGDAKAEVLTLDGLSTLVGLRDRIGFGKEAQKLHEAICNSKDAVTVFARHGVNMVMVAAVAPAGRERVYDLAVPGARHFIAGGIVAHNCNLASLALPSYLVRDASGHATGFNFPELARVAGVATRNLNKVIDLNFYPVETARRSNMRHRPIGIGVQGLANVFAAMRLPYDSPEAADLNRRIFATIYHGAVDASVALAERDGPYETYAGSPTSEGKLQYDLWNPHDAKPETVDGLLDWAALKARMAKHGIRNSLLVAPMPTASTSNILGFVESFEPYTSMAFARRTLAGEFTLVCRELVDALLELGVWDKAMKEAVLRDDGSVQGNPRVPERLRAVFKTAWEIKQRVMINMAADRGPYICQSASQNLFMADAGSSIEKLFNAHLYAHEMGLKTASYYLRTRPPMRIQAFTLEPERPAAAADSKTAAAPFACSRDNPHCESCSG